MIEHEIDAMFTTQATPVEAIHRLRIAVKTIRALLRLAKPKLTRRNYRNADRFFRDLAGRLRSDREADVRLETLDDLARRRGRHLSPDDAAEARRGLLAAMAQDGDEGRQQRLARLRNDLNAQRAHMPLQDLRLNRHEVARGLRRAYRRSRRAYRTALAQPSGRNLHAWRKACKTLLYQLAATPDETAAATYEPDLTALGHRLGRLHDLSRLAKHLRAEPDGGAHARVAALAKRLMKQQAKKALAAGGTLFARRPRDWAISPSS